MSQGLVLSHNDVVTAHGARAGVAVGRPGLSLGMRRARRAEHGVVGEMAIDPGGEAACLLLYK